MIQEQYVSFKVAKLLKDKGFDVYGDGSFGSEIEIHKEYSPNGKTINSLYGSKPHQNAYPAPTQSMAMRWLRETHTLFIEITIDLSDGAYPMYNAKIFNLTMRDNHYVLGYDRYSYEEAVETAIINCLNLI